ncbi:helix-turn-helix domain-containing protein [Marinobacterium halophilum]
MRHIASTFGISTHTVYKWLVRYREAGLAGIE